MLTRSPQQRGFTLIELMITVAIVAILAAIAYPSYTKYVQRGYRSEGLALLNDGVARTERYYAQNNSYSGASITTIGLATSGTTADSTNKKYQLSFAASSTDSSGKTTIAAAAAATNAASYMLMVTPQGSQTSDSCGSLYIDQAGNKTSSTGATDCFK